MKLSELKIGELTAKLPIIQGGMGIGISLHNLAAAVANTGGVGIISGVQIGFREPNFIKNTLEANLHALEKEIALAKEKATQGIIGINFMVAMENYDVLVKKAAQCGIDLIISGAGLPLELPSLVKGSKTKIAPIVSSGKAASLICRMWDKKDNVAPDMIVVEGPLAGGHLGFSREELDSADVPRLEDILQDVKKVLEPFAKKYNKHIPIVVAGGIYDGIDIAKFLELGADGVQMGTRFIPTVECDADINYKMAHINAQKQDIQLVTSPVGMPGRAIINDLMRRDEKNKHCLYKCLRQCKPKEIPYCISQSLINAANGDTDNALLFCGSQGYRAEKIQTVQEVMDDLKQEITACKSPKKNVSDTISSLRKVELSY